MQIERQNIQALFIETMRNAVPANLNLSDEIAHTLGISADSAYRRLRCETEFTLNETVILCNHLEIPLESLNAFFTEAVTFRTNKLSHEIGSFTQYLEALYRDLSWLEKFKDSEIVYAAEDLPVFYSLLFPALARFKMCYWTKSILNVSEMQKKQIEDVKLPDAWNEYAAKITDLFVNVNTTEIWSSDTLKSTIEQFRFYWESGFFRESETAIELLNEFITLVETIEKQAETGKKLKRETSQATQANYILYISDLMIGNNCVFIKGENKTASYIGYNTFNYMRTNNRSFNEQVETWQKNLISKATLISMVSEKQRNMFFKALYNQIDILKQQILER